MNGLRHDGNRVMHASVGMDKSGQNCVSFFLWMEIVFMKSFAGKRSAILENLSLFFLSKGKVQVKVNHRDSSVFTVIP
jgi:hypothetical protein